MQTQIEIRLRSIGHPLGPYTVVATGLVHTSGAYTTAVSQAWRLFTALGGTDTVPEVTEEDPNA